ncbi:MAG TPA: FG-GAP-like repeat-containing protein [Bryobacteraceae bacterium]|nr:FG-GAP-like repeat-containing protein [Bryobacteraceae bacterium]
MKHFLLVLALVGGALPAAAQPNQIPVNDQDPPGGLRNFDLQGDNKTLFTAVTKAFGLECTFDSDYEVKRQFAFRLEQVDYRTALHALEAATGSFAIPLSENRLLVVQDTPDKRRSYEPDIAVTVEIPEAMTPQEMNEAVNAVKQIMTVDKMGVQTQGNRVVIRGPMSRVVPAQRLFDSLMQHHPEVSIDMKLVEVSKSDMVTYGLNLPTNVAISSLTSLSNTTTTLAAIAKGPLGMFGIGIMEAQLVAQMEKSSAHTLMDLQLRASNHQATSFHSGNRYPIVTSEYVGGQATTNTTNTTNTNNNGTSNNSGSSSTSNTPTTFGSVPQPSALAIADFNADGLPDIAAASSSGNEVGVMLGQSGATFADAVLIPVGTAPSAIAAADLNSDGHIDLVTANAGAGSVSILLGNGDGTFQDAVPLSVGSRPTSVVVADLNQDGIPDIATANAGTNDISILYGQKDGTYQSAQSVAAGLAPSGLIAVDLNGDSRPDLVVVNSSANTITVLLASADGGFLAPTAYATGQGPSAIVSGDLNRDGGVDLVVTNTTDATVSVFLGNGQGAFQQGLVFPANAGPTAAVIGDFNLDGALDVAVANTSSGAISLLLGIANGSFQAPIAFQTGANPSSLAAADINKDGVTDIVAANGSSNDFSLLLGTSTGAFHDSGGNTYTATGGTSYAPPPAFTYEDLGLVVKVTPHVNASEEVALDLDAEFKVLTGQSALGMPVIANRKLATKVSVPAGEWVVVGGLLTRSDALSISGLPILTPVLGHRQTNDEDEQVLLLIKANLLSLGPNRLETTPIGLGSETRPRIPY